MKISIFLSKIDVDSEKTSIFLTKLPFSAKTPQFSLLYVMEKNPLYELVRACSEALFDIVRTPCTKGLVRSLFVNFVRRPCLRVCSRACTTKIRQIGSGLKPDASLYGVCTEACTWLVRGLYGVLRRIRPSA